MVTPGIPLATGRIAALCYATGVVGTLLIALFAAALYTGLTWRSR